VTRWEAFMKTMLVLLFPLAVALTACQSGQMRAPEQPSPYAAATGASGTAGSDTASGSGSSYGGETAAIAHRREMCAQSRRIMDAPTPEARQALMEQAMPNMSQEMRERHLTMMRQRCD
jgi:hypothetical protein